MPIVTVFWPNDGITNVSVYWDTHNRNFVDLKTRLMPPADQAFSALLDDLDVRGLLDSTLAGLDGRVWPDAPRGPVGRRRCGGGSRRPRPLAALFLLGSRRRGDQGGNNLRRQRPLGRLPRARPGHPGRPRRDGLSPARRRPRSRTGRPTSTNSTCESCHRCSKRQRRRRLERACPQLPAVVSPALRPVWPSTGPHRSSRMANW